MYCSFYLGEKPYLLVIDLKMLKELLVDAPGSFDEEVGACIGWVYAST